MSAETFKHFVVRMGIKKALLDRGRDVGEFVRVNGEVVDILDRGNMIAYEVESNFTMKKLRDRLSKLSGLRDVFFIDVLDVPDDVSEMEVYLRDKVV